MPVTYLIMLMETEEEQQDVTGGQRRRKDLKDAYSLNSFPECPMSHNLSLSVSKGST